jgi:Ca2+ transporting ATPase
MMDENILVRNLHDVETIGNATTICLDNVGTLCDSIGQWQRAGITVRLVTEDNIDVARSGAIACGILKPEEEFLALEAKEFNSRIRDSSGQINQEQFDLIWPNLRILASAQSIDKYVLVVKSIVGKKTKDEVVAVIGGRISDAFALKKADIGLSMVALC